MWNLRIVLMSAVMALAAANAQADGLECPSNCTEIIEACVGPNCFSPVADAAPEEASEGGDTDVLASCIGPNCSPLSDASAGCPHNCEPDTPGTCPNGGCRTAEGPNGGRGRSALERCLGGNCAQPVDAPGPLTSSTVAACPIHPCATEIDELLCVTGNCRPPASPACPTSPCRNSRESMSLSFTVPVLRHINRGA